MQNHVRNMMQFRKTSCDEGLRSYGRFCVQVPSQAWKRIVNERIFEVFMKKANHLAPFDDRNFITVSKMIVSIIQ